MPGETLLPKPIRYYWCLSSPTRCGPSHGAITPATCRQKCGQKIPRDAWSFTAIERAFDKAVALSGSTRSGYKLYGHSAGAQFVHRFIMFTGGPRVERAVAANAGWYTLPRKADTLPYGLDGIDVADETLREAFSVPLDHSAW